MLADKRAKSLVTNFASEWLSLRVIEGAKPDPIVFPEFDDGLRAAFEKETEMLLDSVLLNDHSVLELLNANYTFVNERLARHYGIPNVYGDQFRRVTVNDGIRGGLLGQGSILTATSYPNRTSPVLRGKWILETCWAVRHRLRHRTCRRCLRLKRPEKLCRCVCGFPSTVRIRLAQAATRGWIRWDSRWRISMQPGNGGR